MVRLTRDTAPFRNVLGVLVVAALTLVLTGCWDRREVESLAFVTATGIDLDDATDPGVTGIRAADTTRFRIVVEIANAGGGGGTDPGASGARAGVSQPTMLGFGVGVTPFDALQDIQAGLGRTLFVAHNRVVVVSAEIPRNQKLPQVFDYFERSPQARGNALLVFADGIPAAEVIAATAPVSGRSGSALYDLIQTTHTEHGTPLVTIREFLVRSSLEGIDPIAGRIVRGTRTAAGGAEGAGSLGPVPQAVPPVRLSGVALFRGDTYVGSLDEAETKGLLWAIGQVKDSFIDVPCPGAPEHSFTYLVQRSSGKVSLTLQPALRGRIAIVMEGRLADVECPRTAFDVTTASVDDAHAQLKRRIEESVRGAVDKTQRLGVDPFGFGAALHRNAPERWHEVRDEWFDTIWPRLPVDIEVTVDIRRPGLVGPGSNVNR